MVRKKKKCCAKTTTNAGSLLTYSYPSVRMTVMDKYMVKTMDYRGNVLREFGFTADSVRAAKQYATKVAGPVATVFLRTESGTKYARNCFYGWHAC